MDSLAYLEADKEARRAEKEGTKYIVAVDDIWEQSAVPGDIVTLVINDNSSCPFFRCPGSSCFIDWSKLRRVNENDNEEIKRAHGTCPVDWRL